MIVVTYIERKVEIDSGIDGESEPNREQINSRFIDPIDTQQDSTVTIFEENRTMYVQRCLLVNFYYATLNLYDNPD